MRLRRPRPPVRDRQAALDLDHRGDGVGPPLAAGAGHDGGDGPRIHRRHRPRRRDRRAAGAESPPGRRLLDLHQGRERHPSRRPGSAVRHLARIGHSLQGCDRGHPRLLRRLLQRVPGCARGGTQPHRQRTHPGRGRSKADHRGDHPFGSQLDHREPSHQLRPGVGRCRGGGALWRDPGSRGADLQR